MENGEYTVVDRSELSLSEDKNDDDSATDPSHLQAKPCKKITPAPPVEMEDNKAAIRQAAKDKRQLASDNELNKLLGLVGKYLYQKNVKKTKTLTKKTVKMSLIKDIKPKIEKGNDEKGTEVVKQVKKRNWRRLSIHPFVNFLREYRRNVPQKYSQEILEIKGNEMWQKMDKDCKLRYYQKAERAKKKGYLE